MRKSLQDLSPNFVRKVDDYPGLPEDLREYCYHLSDSGYVIMAVVKSLIDDMGDRWEPWELEVGIPVRYVLEKGWEKYEDYIIVDAPYDHNLGLVVDEKYSEY